MKRSKKSVSLLLVSAMLVMMFQCFGTISTLTVSAQSGNLIPNNGFENVTVLDSVPTPDGWTLTPFDDNHYAYADEDMKHTGNYSLALHSSDGASVNAFTNTQGFTPGKYYKISGYYLASGMGYYAQVSVMSSNWANTYTTLRLFNNSQWAYFEQVFTVSSACDYGTVELKLEAGANGTLHFDDVALTEYDSEPLKADTHPDNMISTDTFESGSLGTWESWTGGSATMSVTSAESYRGTKSLTAQNVNSYTTMYAPVRGLLKTNTVYTVSGAIKSSMGQYNVVTVALQGGADREDYQDLPVIDIPLASLYGPSGWVYFTCEFTTPSQLPWDTKLQFHTDGVGSYYIDDISFYEKLPPYQPDPSEILASNEAAKPAYSFKNGDAERGNTSEWGTWEHNAGDSTFGVSSTEKNNGGYSFYVQPAHYISISQYIDLTQITAGKTYMAEAYVKTKRMGSLQGLRMVYNVNSNATIKTTPYVYGSQDWQRIAIRFTAPTNPSSILIAFEVTDRASEANAEFWFDDIVLYEIVPKGDSTALSNSYLEKEYWMDNSMVVGEEAGQIPAQVAKLMRLDIERAKKIVNGNFSTQADMNTALTKLNACWGIFANEFIKAPEKLELSNVSSIKLLTGTPYIYNITGQTTVSQIKNAFDGSGYIKVFNGAAELSDSDTVMTGATVKIISGSEVKDTKQILVMGDVDCDGEVSVSDLVAIKKNILVPTLSGAALAAGGINNGGTSITSNDLVTIKKQMLGIIPPVTEYEIGNVTASGASLNVSTTANINPLVSFGAEWDPHFLMEYNLNKTNGYMDYYLIEKRVKELGIDRVRVMWRPEWHEISKDNWNIDPDNNEILQALLIQLDLLERCGIKATLAYWGAGKDTWLGTPHNNAGQYWSMPNNLNDYSNNVAELLKYLKLTKNDTVIDQLIIFNEPSLGYINASSQIDFPSFAQLYTKIDAALTTAGVRNLVGMVASDDSTGKMHLSGTRDCYGIGWFTNNVNTLDSITEAYSTHSYAFDGSFTNAQIQAELKDYFDAMASAGSTKPVMVTEFGTQNYIDAYNISDADTYARATYLPRFCINFLNAGGAGASYWSLFDQYYYEAPEALMGTGLWKYADNSYTPRAMYYFYGLLTKYSTPGSLIYKITSSDDDISAVALIAPNGKTTYFVHNNASSAKTFTINNNSAAKGFYDKIELNQLSVLTGDKIPGAQSTVAFDGQHLNSTISALGFAVITEK